MPKVTYFNANYYVYYELVDHDENKRRIITNKGVLETIEQHDERYKQYTDFPMLFIEDDPSDKVLTEYLKNLKKWMYSAKLNRVYSIDFSKGHIKAAQTTFFSLIKNYKQHEPITSVEYKWFERCANNALYYLKQDNIEVECTSYDRKMCYGNILGSKIKIPIKKGKEYKLKKLPTLENMKYGFYRVKITCKDTDLLYKTFVLSPQNTYVNISLKFAIENKDILGLTIELIMDDEPNAYLYEECDMIELDSCTSEWLKIAKELKTKYKSNPLLKFIASGTWGVIQQRNKLVYTLDQINEKNLDVGLDDKSKYKLIGRKTVDNIDYYILVNTANAYKYKMRLKPFITAQARYDMGTLAIKYLDNIVRCQTDSISFDKPIDINDDNYCLEIKTSGLIHWYNVNKYHNKTTGYKSKNLL